MAVTRYDEELVERHKQSIERIIGASRIRGPQRDVIQERLLAAGADQRALATEAGKARERTVGNVLIVRASLEFSNRCRQECSFCAMKASNTALARYALDKTQMTAVIESVHQVGIRNLHLASGEDWAYRAEDLEPTLNEAMNRGIETTMATSHRRLPDYEAFWRAGARRYILKVETTNPTLFADARMGTILETRLAHLLHLRDLGFKIGSGIICGLPGQGIDDLAGDILFMKELGPDMASVSRFQPNPDSRYGVYSEGDIDTTLNVASLMRIEISTVGLRIPATTTLGPRQGEALMHGANVVSLHVTPEDVADRYSADRIGERRLTRSLDSIRKMSQETGMMMDTVDI